MLTPQQLTAEILGTHVSGFDNRSEQEIRNEQQIAQRWHNSEMEIRSAEFELRIEESKKKFLR